MTLDWTFQTHLLLNRAQTLAQTMKKTGCQTWSGGDGASHQQIPAAVGEAREKGLQGPGNLTFTLAQDCTRVCLLYVCDRGYGGWLSPSTGRRSGQYVTSSELRLYLHAQDHSILTRGYPSSRFFWWYRCPVNSTILVLSMLENRSIWQYERYFFYKSWQCSISNLYSYS